MAIGKFSSRDWMAGWLKSVAGPDGGSAKDAFVQAVTPTDSAGAEIVAATAANQAATQQLIGSTKYERATLANGAGVQSGLASYVATGAAYGGYATPTDMLCITGSATKKVVISFLFMRIHSTAAALQTIYYIKRSTLNTGGTSTNPAAVSLDSSNPAATATVTLYTAAPTLGTAVGTTDIIGIVSSVPTATYGSLSSAFVGDIVSLSQPITLNNQNESFCFNYNGAALTSGFDAIWQVRWSEFTAP